MLSDTPLRTSWRRPSSSYSPRPNSATALLPTTASSTTSTARCHSPKPISPLSKPAWHEVVARDEKFQRVEEPREQGLTDYEKSGEFMKVHFIERFTKPGDDHLALQERQLHRLLPRPARAFNRPREGVQGHVHRRRVLARRRKEPAAPAHLRHSLLQRRRTSTRTSSISKRSRRATIASSASSSTCSPSRRSPAPASSSGTPRAASSAKRWKTGCATSASAAATRWSSRRTSCAASSGRSPATRATTPRTCTRPWSSTTRSTGSSP